MTMAAHTEQKPSYSQFACIGTGFSAIALGATLKRWYGITDICFFERHKQLGGTWFVNKYPGTVASFSLFLFFGKKKPQQSASLKAEHHL